MMHKIIACNGYRRDRPASAAPAPQENSDPNSRYYSDPNLKYEDCFRLLVVTTGLTLYAGANIIAAPLIGVFTVACCKYFGVDYALGKIFGVGNKISTSISDTNAAKKIKAFFEQNGWLHKDFKWDSKFPTDRPTIEKALENKSLEDLAFIAAKQEFLIEALKSVYYKDASKNVQRDFITDIYDKHIREQDEKVQQKYMAIFNQYELSNNKTDAQKEVIKSTLIDKIVDQSKELAPFWTQSNLQALILAPAQNSYYAGMLLNLFGILGGLITPKAENIKSALNILMSFTFVHYFVLSSSSLSNMGYKLIEELLLGATFEALIKIQDLYMKHAAAENPARIFSLRKKMHYLGFKTILQGGLDWYRRRLDALNPICSFFAAGLGVLVTQGPLNKLVEKFSSKVNQLQYKALFQFLTYYGTSRLYFWKFMPPAPTALVLPDNVENITTEEAKRILAFQLLKLHEKTSIEKNSVTDAHKELIKKIHPDHACNKNNTKACNKIQAHLSNKLLEARELLKNIPPKELNKLLEISKKIKQLNTRETHELPVCPVDGKPSPPPPGFFERALDMVNMVNPVAWYRWWNTPNTSTNVPSNKVLRLDAQSQL